MAALTRSLVAGGAALTSLIAIVVSVAAPASAAAPTLSPTATPDFPERAYLLTLPERVRLGAEDVVVTENGGPVRDLRVSSAGAARLRKMGVVLAIDSSGSMRGAAFSGAFDAARTFSAARDERQPLALVTYGTDIAVPMRFTTDPRRIDRILGTPDEPSGGTHLYDGVMQGIELVRKSHLPGGVVVVLSDGADHGSTANAAEVIGAARAARVRVYTIGLRSPSFDPPALRELAQRTNGRYTEASSPDELGAIYSELGAELSNAHLLTYRSLAGPRRSVEVAVDVSGQGTARASYMSPRLSLQGTGNGGSAGPWQSSLAVLLGAVLVAGLVGLAAWLVLRRGEQSPRDRVQRYVEAAAPPAERRRLSERLTTGAERSVASAGWWQHLAYEVDLAGLTQSPGQVVGLTAAATGVTAAAVAGLTGQGLLLVPVIISGPLLLRAFLRARVERQRQQFGDQLADHLAVVGGALRAGHSLPAAFAAVLDDAPEPSRGEFARAVADERLGSPMEEALESVAGRMDSRDVEQVALLARLQREVGANAAEMLDRVVDTIRERQELRRAVRTLTAQGRMSRWILTALPVVVLVFLTLTNGSYIEPLFSSGLGKILLVVAGLMVAAGSLVIKQIVEFRI